MNQPNTPSDAAARCAASLAVDEDGLLYDRSFREHLLEMSDERDPDRMALAEAMKALRTVARTVQMSMERWAERHDLSEGRLYVLMRLRYAHDHQLPLGEIAHHLDVSPRNITGLVDHLEKDGLVLRVPDPHDRRSVMARLTPAGETKIKQLWSSVYSRHSDIARSLNREDLTQLRHLCLRLLQGLHATQPDTAAQEATR